MYYRLTTTMLAIGLCACASVPKIHADYSQSLRTPQSLKSPYKGCLIFLDDARSAEDLSLAVQFGANSLLRSWYRFGAPSAEKEYSLRIGFIESARAAGVSVGGGASLSVVNSRDISRSDFDPDWLSRNQDGSVYREGEKAFASLSAPGFRSYIIARVLEQVRIGASELHFGETNGKILFDDWSLGLKGRHGFIQWIKEKYADKDENFWIQYLGGLGRKLAEGGGVVRSDFLSLKPPFLNNLKQEWGTKSWSGVDDRGRPAFLASVYKNNLESFLSELRAALDRDGFRDISIDIWGFAPWMSSLVAKPDAFITSPPDERWGLNWNTDPNFSLEIHAEQIRKEMLASIQAVAPVPVIYMFDHPVPFQTGFDKLTDERQALLTKFFAELSKELGASFVFRSYSLESGSLGPKTRSYITGECKRQHDRSP